MRMMSKKLKIVLLSALCGTVVAGSAVGIALAGGGKDKNVTLKFDVDGGAAIEDVVANKGDEVTLPTPQREGYKFEGWYLNESFEGEPIKDIVAEGDVTYYAKWSQLCVITLDLNGGTLSTTTVYAENGANVYDAVKNYAPTKEGFIFGAWFNGDKELAKNTRLTETGITLTAQYKVEYTVEIHVQNVNDNDYTKSETLSYTGSDYVGVSVSVNPDVDGCTKIEKQGEVLTKTLSAVSAENVFVVYYDRNVYKVIFNPNLPDGSSGTTYEVEGRYGAEVEVPANVANYLFEGYCMMGWSTGAGSDEIAYKTNLDALLYNATEDEEEGTENEESAGKITILRPTMLYGVWQAGATDLFGGNDYIYTLEGEEDAIYLARGSIFFKGEYEAETGEFEFFDYTNNELGLMILRGKLFENGKFLYNDPNRGGSAVLYKHNEAEPINRVDNNIKISYDSLNNITYTQYDPETDSRIDSTGTYENVGLAEYKAVFTEGPMAGQTMQFLIGTITENENTFDGFLVRNEEEYNLGKIYLSGVTDNGVGGYKIGYVETVYVEFNGYGQATYVAEEQQAVFNYIKNQNGYYEFSDANGKNAGVLRLTKDTAISVDKGGYFLYDQQFDQTFTLANGGTLTLDGMVSAVYEKDGKSISSYYMAETMPMGGTLISIVDANNLNKPYKFLVTFTDEKGAYTAVEVPETYAEYYYKNADNIYYGPMLVIDETEVGKATLYGYTAERKFVKVAVGTYTEIDDGDYDGMYQFTVTESFAAEGVLTEPVDLSTVQSFVFATNDTALNYSVHYWCSMNGGDSYCEYYTERDGNGSLMLVGGFIYYKSTPTIKATVGVYNVGIGCVFFYDLMGQGYFFELYNDNTYRMLEYVPFMAYLLQSNNIVTQDFYMWLDGKGGATYYYTQSEEEGGQLTTTTGTITAKGMTEFGSTIYTFVSNDGITFDYILISLSESTYFLMANDAYTAGKYVSADDPAGVSLTIDGFCYKAIYKNGKEVLEGNYYIKDDGTVCFLKETVDVYFDMLGEGKFTVRGQEEGVYAFFENGDFKGYYFELDGYGNFSMFTLKKAEKGYERVSVVENGAYIVEDNYFTLTYSKDGEPVVYTFENTEKAYYSIDGNPYIVLMLEQDLERKILIDTTDWAVLMLDNFGNAIKYDRVGQKQLGSYTLVSDNLLYFINSDNTDACIYDYDMKTGAASPIELGEKTYYTTDLRSLVFSKYGFAIFDGDRENQIFYTVDYCEEEDCGGEGKKCPGHVTIHRSIVEGEDLTGKVVSDYGFVMEDFGKFEETKFYNGTTYYRSKGSDIRFTREEDDLKRYPLKLGETTIEVKSVQFAPGGGLEFMVSGLAEIVITTVNETTGQVSGSTQMVNCSVGRELDKDNNARLFVVIEGYFRLYMDATFTGNNSENEENTFVANGLQYNQHLYSLLYLDEFYRTYIRKGASAAYALQNEYGALTLICDIDEEGKEVEYSVHGEFGEKTNLFDTKGERLTKIEGAKWLSIGSISYVSFTMSDGLEYRLYFGQSTNPYLGMTGYYIHAFVRVQKLEVEGGYTVEVGKALYTDIMGIALDDVFFMSVTKGTELDIDDKYVFDARQTLYFLDGVWYCANRKYNEDPEYALEAMYYLITLEENEDGTVAGEGDDETQIYPTYKSATLTITKTTIAREIKDGAVVTMRYVEIIEFENAEGEKESKVAFMFLYGNLYVVEECTYDAATQTYTVVTTDNRKFAVKVVGINVVIEEIRA